jgi:predicted DNA-binding mobile mystery protein A
MKSNYQHKTRDVLDRRLNSIRRLRSELATPVGGWIRCIRLALGMNSRHLGERIGVGADWVRVLERNESAGAVTLRSLQKAADAMNCDLVYTFLPRESLRGMVEKQARKVAELRSKRVSHSMMLEEQQPTSREQEKIIADLIRELVRTMPRTLWDER